MLVGAHVSVAGGYERALDYAVSVGAECMQFFAKSPRQWRGKAIDPEAAAAFVALRAERGFGPVFTHTAYLLNLSTADDVLRAKTVDALADELTRAALVGASGVVAHVGNDATKDVSAAAARTADTILRAYELAGEVVASVRLLLENTAGGGTSFGCTFGELAAAIEVTGMGADVLGVCFDTCHGFAFGMPLDTAEGWRETIDEIEATIGFERLALIHANDCMFERGSRRDRHAWIGDGFIGGEGFSAMMCAPELAHAAVITEMPGEVPIKDSENLSRLKKMREFCP